MIEETELRPETRNEKRDDACLCCTRSEANGSLDLLAGLEVGRFPGEVTP